jgi:squalene-hopene/tetraprenyl-beta-curcumene cyclase
MQSKTLAFAFSILASTFAGPVLADDLGPDRDAYHQSIERAVAYLRTTQAEDGSWTAPTQVGLTALVAASLLESGLTADDPTIVRAMQFLESHIQPDGGLYHPDSKHKNYETAIAIIAFEAANDGRYNETLDHAVAYLKGLQWDEGEGINPDDPFYGGAGYGGHARPDMSNTQFFIDALIKAGVPQDDPAIQNALIFVSRAQNLESEHNTTPFASLVNDGGFYYTPAAGGTSQAGTNPDGGLRSYASMTYAGLKSFIHAGLTPDDPRVEAATNWIKQFYSLDENPGLDQQGLYYYYHTFAKALSVAGYDTFADAEGVEHDWRKELAEHLFAAQQADGSWLNTTDRWMEGDPNLVTAYALLALSYCKPTEPAE